MGNSSSRRRPKDYSISPGEDAAEALIPSTSVSLLQDNTIFLHESFFSLNPCEMDESNPDSCLNRFVTGTEETPECLNSSNFHTSFFASLVLGRNKYRQSESQTLINVVNSHRWSAQCPEYVALCASFILSILEMYGQCIPQDRRLISQKSIVMFNALDDLYKLISEMKKSSWHVDDTSARWKSCRDCDIRQMVLMQVNFQNRCADKICPICLQFASVCKTDIHNRLRTWLLSDIFPFSCSICQMRFSAEVDLQHHCTIDCQNIAVDGQADRPPSKLFGCFLCRVPFKTRRDLTIHTQSSLEHALRKEVATELALRNAVASDKSCDLQIKSTLNKQLVYEENLIETATSSPDVSDAQYYCSPCSTFVQKCNVVDHERGLKHRLKCEGWINCLQKKSKEPCQEVKISSENKSSTVSRSKGSFKDASTSMDYSEYESVDLQVEKLLEEFFILEKEQVENCGKHYLCIKCSFQGKTFEMLSHRLGKNQCCNMDKQDAEILEEKLRILTSLVSLLVMKQMYDLLKFINMDAVQRLIDVLCVKKGQNLSEVDKLDVFEESDSTSIPALLEETDKNNDKIAEEVSLPQLSDDIILTEGSGTDVQLNKQLDCAELTPNDDINTITEEDIRRKTEKYFLLDGIKEITTGCYLCKLCNLKCMTSAMINHAFGKSHFKSKYLKSQPISTLKEKLIIIEFFKLAKAQNKALVYHNKMLDSAINKIQNYLTHVKRSSLLADSNQKRAKECVASGSRITIGDSASLSLQEQLQTACAGRDLSDFEMECGTCGAVFEVFNDDVDFSLDMHIQTDPQHALATAVPVERDIHSVIESTPVVKSTADHPNSESDIHSVVESTPVVNSTAKHPSSEFKEKSRLLDLIAENEKQVSDFQVNKERVIDEVLKLEQKYVAMQGNKFYCELCVVYVGTGSQITHHILSPRHMSFKWIRRHTPDELNQKLLQLKSLLKYKYAGAALCLAIDTINKYQGNEKRPSESQSLLVAEPCQKESQTFYCEICKINMNINSKGQHIRGKKHKANTSALIGQILA